MNTNELSAAQLAAYIDHTLLKPDASRAQLEQLCAEAIDHKFFSVCVNGSWVMTARHLLENTDIKVACVVGFPLGAMAADVKRFETETAVDDGAHEIDVAEAADERTVKVILETCLLTDAEKIRACQLVVESGAHFVKTSTGFSTAGATLADVKLMRETVGPKFGVKASGGVRDAQTALAMIAAGATRLGTSSGIAIVKGLAGSGNY